MNTTPYRSVFRSTATAYAFLLPVLALGFGDPFSYSPGDLQTVSSGKWFSWLNSSQIATDTHKRAVIGSTRNDSMARLLRPRDGNGNTQSWAEDSLYLRFNLEVADVPATGNGEYFACFSDMAGNRRGRIFIQRSGAGTYQLGASFASILPQVLTPNLSINQNYRVVVKLNRLNKQVTVWVDPASEASPGVTSTDLSSQFSYDVVVLRQSNQYGGVGSLYVDNLIVGAAFNEVAAPIFDVTDPAWGPNPAVADDNIADGPGIRQALTALKNSGQPGILLFPTGTYILDEVGAVKVPYDGNVYSNALVLDGLANPSVIEGSGSTLLIKNSVAPAPGYAPSYAKVSPFFLANCPGLTLKNLRFSYERPSVSTGTVGTVTPRTPLTGYSREWRFPVTVDGLPLPLGDNAWAVDGVSDMDAVTGLPLMNLSARDNGPGKNYIDWSLANSGGVSTYTLTVRTNTSDVDRLKHLDLTMAQITGSKVILHHPSGGAVNGLYGPPTLAAYKCSNVTLRDVEINGNVGMGFKASECTHLAFKRVDLVPLPGQLLSTAKDGIFLSLCQGQITFDDCLLQATGDDSINVHATKFLAISGSIPVSGPLKVNAAAGDGTFSGPTPLAGDTYQFLQKGDNLNAPYMSGSTPFVGTVLSATRSGNTLLITFNALPAGLKATDYMFKTNGAPTVSVTNCTFSGGIARGLVLSTNGITVSNSLFEDIAFNGIYFVADPARSGAQAPGSKNVLVTHCEFAGCGAAPIGTLSSSYNPPSRPSEVGMFQDFTITNNIFSPDSTAHINTKRLARRTTGGVNESFRSAYMQSALYLPSLGGTNLVQNNQLGGTNPDTGFNPAVYLNHTLGVSLLNNAAPGMKWRRSVLLRPSPTHYDPAPSFGLTPTGGSTDYLVLADQEAINTSGNPTTSDSDLFGYARPLGDIQ